MKCIYFVIDIRILKIIKVFKNPEYIEVLKSREDSIYLFLYGLQVYRGSICYVSETKGISFKSYATQVLDIFKRESNTSLEKSYSPWNPSYGVDKNLILKN